MRLRTRDSQGTHPEYWFGDNLRMIDGLVEQYVKVGDRTVAKVNLTYQPGVTSTSTDTIPDGATVAAVDDGGAVSAAATHRAGGRAARLASARLAGAGLLAALSAVVAALGLAGVRRTRRLGPALASLLVITLLTPGCSAFFSSSSSAPLWKPSKVTYFHTGFAAGPVLLTNESARIVDERRYEPFGQAIDSYREPGGLFDSVDYVLEPLNILNKPTDPRTGWSYHGARWMAPQTARWLTPDPPVKAPAPKFMAAPWKLHPYQYVEQNPVVYWDPDGQNPAYGALIGAGLGLLSEGIEQIAERDFRPWDLVTAAAGGAVSGGMAAAVPAATGLRGAIIGGALSVATGSSVVRALRNKETSIGDLARELAIGGATGGAFSKILDAAAESLARRTPLSLRPDDPVVGRTLEEGHLSSVVGGAVRGRPVYLPDFSTENTVSSSSFYASERHARSVARDMLGRDPVQVAPGKLRSLDGKWQYRGKPQDLAGHSPGDTPCYRAPLLMAIAAA